MNRNFLNTFRKKLCPLCKYYKRERKKGLFCSVTGQKPNFISVCPYFNLSFVKDKKTHNQFEDFLNVRKKIVLANIFILFFLVIIDVRMIIIVVFFVAILLFLFYSDKFLPHPIIKKTDWFAFLYLSASAYWINKNDKNFSVRPLVEQTAIILYGNFVVRDFVIFIINNKNNDLLINLIKKYEKKISFLKKIKLLYFLVEMNFFIQNKEPATITEIADLLGIGREILKKIYAEVEKYIFTQQSKKEKSYVNQNTTLFDYYLSVLELKGDVSFKDIKKQFYKLSKLYHPDRYSSSSIENIQKSIEKYKKITEAYNFFKELSINDKI